MARTVKAIWLDPRPTCPPPYISRDWQELQAAMREAGRDPADCLVAHENFVHVVPTTDPAKAREEQHRAFLKVMSNERGPAYLESVYLFGTPDEIIASLQARIDAGVEYFFLHTMTPDPAQLSTGSTRSSPTSRSVHRGAGSPPADAVLGSAPPSAVGVTA
jgi:alkanesulfonate monooxygenase SsuD/methylene tetrahydromethanopterin reductase-like flavin-dependent oxidoreductase (luciferase family)